MRGPGVRQSDRGTHRRRGATRAVWDTSEDVARPYAVGVGALPRAPVDLGDDVPAVAADVDIYRSAPCPASGDETRRTVGRARRASQTL
jgi:hypothetical protein